MLEASIFAALLDVDNLSLNNIFRVEESNLTRLTECLHSHVDCIPSIYACVFSGPYKITHAHYHMTGTLVPTSSVRLVSR